MAAGPIRPGVRLRSPAGFYAVGNAAGEAHPVIAEGLSMAIQSAWLLSNRLLRGEPIDFACRGYANDWRRAFLPRLRTSRLLAAWAMRPIARAATMPVLAGWPSLLTWFARLSGKANRSRVTGRRGASFTPAETDTLGRSARFQGRLMSFVIHSIATAVPGEPYAQEETAECAAIVSCTSEKDATSLRKLFRTTRIQQRHTVHGRPQFQAMRRVVVGTGPRTQHGGADGRIRPRGCCRWRLDRCPGRGWSASIRRPTRISSPSPAPASRPRASTSA